MIRIIGEQMTRACCAGAALLACASALAITPEELQREVADGKAPTIIDVRTVELFKAGHVPNSINIPATLVPQKSLPRLGRVVVYGDGFGDSEQKALAALNAKPGVQAELLEGGYSAWEAAQGTTTGNRGLNPEKLQYVTYQQLQDTTSNVVLVDLRKEAKPKLGAASVKTGDNGNASVTLSDLTQAFPGKPITKSAHKPEGQLGAKSVGAANQPILVLIDNADGTAQETARQLRAQGNSRVVILAGGETTVARQGQRGLQRTGQSLENFNDAIRGNSK